MLWSICFGQMDQSKVSIKRNVPQVEPQVAPEASIEMYTYEWVSL